MSSEEDIDAVVRGDGEIRSEEGEHLAEEECVELVHRLTTPASERHRRMIRHLVECAECLELAVVARGEPIDFRAILESALDPSTSWPEAGSGFEPQAPPTSTRLRANVAGDDEASEWATWTAAVPVAGAAGWRVKVTLWSRPGGSHTKDLELELKHEGPAAIPAFAAVSVAYFDHSGAARTAERTLGPGRSVAPLEIDADLGRPVEVAATVPR